MLVKVVTILLRFFKLISHIQVKFNTITVCENSNSFFLNKFIDMENINDLDSIYGEDTIDIHGEVFDKDFDEVGFDPVEEDDSDVDAAELYDY